MSAALRRLAVVAATSSLLAGLPFAAPAHAAPGGVTNVSPISAANTATATVDFRVASSYLAAPEPTVKFVRAGDANDVITLVDSQVRVTGSDFEVDVPLTRENPGAWNIEVSGYVAGSAQPVVDSCAGCFTVLALQPTITRAVRTFGGGAAGIPLTVSGTGFTDSVYCSSGACAGQPTISVSGSGVTLGGSGTNGAEVAATGGTTIQKLVTVAAGAATGARDITVTNTDGKSAVCDDCLVVGETPTLTAVSPAGLAPGASNRTVELTGTNFAPGATVAITIPNTTTQTANKVAVSNTVVHSPTRITVSVSVEDTAPTLGDRAVRVTNPDNGTVSRADLFDVNAKPVVSGVAYTANTAVDRYGQGALNRTLRVNGTGFQNGATVAFASPAGITVDSTTVVDATQLNVAVTLGQVDKTPASVGAHAVTVTNPDGGVSGSASNLTVGTGPDLDTVTPAARGRGETVSLTLKGTNFATTGVTVEIKDVAISSATVQDAQTILVAGVVGSGLNIAGERDVVVTNTNDKGRYVCAGCFTIANLQVNSITPGNVLNEGVQTFTITGSGFTTDAVATLRKTGAGAGLPDITGTNTTVNGEGTALTVSFPLGGVAPGGWSIRVQNPTTNPGVGVCTCVLTVVAPAPDVTGVSPAVRGEGAKDETITITGTHFAPGAAVSFSNSKITVAGAPVVTPTSITVKVDVASGAVTEDAAMGEAKTITVTNTDGVADSTGFTTAKAPVAESIDVARRAAGTQVLVKLTGNDLVDGASLIFSGTGVTAGEGDLTADGEGVVNDDTLAVPVTVAANALAGERTVTVRNPDGGRAACACTFTVTAQPTITSVTPAKAAVGRTSLVAVEGTGFATGATVAAVDGVTGTVTYVSPTRLDVSLTVAAAAATGGRALTVSNTDGGSVSRAAAYQVITVPGAPTTVAATRGDRSATVTWAAPANTGNDPIKSYTVTAAPGGATVTTVDGSTLTATVSGLTNGTPYTFTVVAKNDAGAGVASAESLPVTPATVPGAPTAVSATAGKASATVTWTAPAANGGNAVKSYTVTSSPEGKTATVEAPATQATIPGLTPGTPYTFTVVATNDIGSSPASAASAPVSPVSTAVAPSAPRTVTATGGNGSATVTWTAPADDGGAAITGYTVTSTPGGKQAKVGGDVLSAVVEGLDNGVPYAFAVVATNAMGDSAAGTSNAVTPATVPGAPTAVAGTPANGAVNVAWAAPASDGGAAVSGYVVKATPGDHTVEVAGDVLGATVSGLANGTAYTFTVHAVNAAGAGAASAPSDAVTPRTVAGAPTAVSATRGDTRATVTWTAPADNGGAAITGYTVTSTPGGLTATVAADTLTAVVTGLANGTEYTFAVVATNEAGNGAAGTSNAVTPAGVPLAPTGVTATAGHAAATVSWTAANGNGSLVTTYTVTISPGGTTQEVTGTSATFTGLTNGVAYTFGVKATNALGTGPAGTSNAVRPTWVTTLTETATAQVVSGGTAVVRGRLATSSGIGLHGATIEIYRRTAPSTSYVFVRTVTTGADGLWSTSFTVTKNTAFGAYFDGAPGFEPATSVARLTKAAYKVTAAYSLSGRTVTVGGSVSPNAAGRTVYLRHRRADGSLVTLATKTVAANGTYRVSKTLSRGTYSLFVYIGASTTNVAGRSAYRSTKIS